MSDAFPPALPHGPINEIFPDIFLVRGGIRFGPGIVITRNMTAIRQGGELTLLNSVRLTPDGERALEALGEVKHLVRLGSFHGMDDPYYKHRYNPTFWAMPGMKPIGGMHTDEELKPEGRLPIPDASFMAFQGAKQPEGAFVLPREGGILLSTDAVQNWTDFAGCSWAGRLMMKALGFGGPGQIGPMWLKRNQRALDGGFAPDFQRLLGMPFRHLVSGHGDVLRDTAHAALDAQVAKAFPSAAPAARP